MIRHYYYYIRVKVEVGLFECYDNVLIRVKGEVGLFECYDNVLLLSGLRGRFDFLTIDGLFV